MSCAGHPSIEEYELKDAGAGRGPLCLDNMRALPLAIPLPSEAGSDVRWPSPQGGEYILVKAEHRAP